MEPRLWPNYNSLTQNINFLQTRFDARLDCHFTIPRGNTSSGWFRAKLNTPDRDRVTFSQNLRLLMISFFVSNTPFLKDENIILWWFVPGTAIYHTPFPRPISNDQCNPFLPPTLFRPNTIPEYLSHEALFQGHNWGGGALGARASSCISHFGL